MAEHVRLHRLQCAGCGAEFPDDRVMLTCPSCGPKALLRTRYRPLQLRGAADQFSSYRDWLPHDIPADAGDPRMGLQQAPQLGRALGVPRLWVLFSGYAPTFGSEFLCGTFKEGEAIGVLSRMAAEGPALAVSSAGNAGAAFLQIGSALQRKLVIVVPEAARERMRVAAPPGPVRPLLVLLKNATYNDAIALVDRLVQRFPGGLIKEGGVFNVGRRDGMSIPFISAAIRMGHLPDRYVQAVGSGSGAIGVVEACDRLIAQGMPPARMTRLLLVQNLPFTPMVDAWRMGCSHVAPMTAAQTAELISQTEAKVLSNANPPWGQRGGVADALRRAGGGMVAVTNQQIRQAHHLIAAHLGLDVCPASAAATAGLVDGVANGLVDPDEEVLLHLTGGGFDALQAKTVPYPVGCLAEAGDEEAIQSVVQDYLDA